MMSPLPWISSAISLIKQDEKQKQGCYTPNSFIGAFKNNNSQGVVNLVSQNAVNTGSKLKNTSGSYQGNKSGLKCSYCNKESQLREQCYKLIGYLDKQKGKGKFNSNQGNANPSGFRPLPQTDNANSGNSTNTATTMQVTTQKQGNSNVNCNASPTLEELQS